MGRGVGPTNRRLGRHAVGPRCRASRRRRGLRGIDPARYDVASSRGRLLVRHLHADRRVLRSPGRVDPLGGLDRNGAAVGESQSAFELTTYLNGVQPLPARSTASSCTAAAQRTCRWARAGKRHRHLEPRRPPRPPIRTDTDAPVSTSRPSRRRRPARLPAARQPDTAVPPLGGPRHRPRRRRTGRRVGGLSSAASTPINDGQQVYVLRSAIHHLDTWVTLRHAAPAERRAALPSTVRPVPTGAGPPMRRGTRRGGVSDPRRRCAGRRAVGRGARLDASLVCLLSGSIGADPDPTSSRHHVPVRRTTTSAMYDAATRDENDRRRLRARGRPRPDHRGFPAHPHRRLTAPASRVCPHHWGG